MQRLELTAGAHSRQVPLEGRGQRGRFAPDLTWVGLKIRVQVPFKQKNHVPAGFLRL